jgi:hypothetical protein
MEHRPPSVADSFHANSSAPAWVNLTKVPDLSIQPAARDRKLEPGAVLCWRRLVLQQKRAIDQLDEDPATIPMLKDWARKTLPALKRQLEWRGPSTRTGNKAVAC